MFFRNSDALENNGRERGGEGMENEHGESSNDGMTPQRKPNRRTSTPAEIDLNMECEHEESTNIRGENGAHGETSKAKMSSKRNRKNRVVPGCGEFLPLLFVFFP